jgi:hypothetical protein
MASGKPTSAVLPTAFILNATDSTRRPLSSRLYCGFMGDFSFKEIETQVDKF